MPLLAQQGAFCEVNSVDATTYVGKVMFNAAPTEVEIPADLSGFLKTVEKGTYTNSVTIQFILNSEADWRTVAVLAQQADGFPVDFRKEGGAKSAANPQLGCVDANLMEIPPFGGDPDSPIEYEVTCRCGVITWSDGVAGDLTFP